MEHRIETGTEKMFRRVMEKSLKSKNCQNLRGYFSVFDSGNKCNILIQIHLLDGLASVELMVHPAQWK